MRLTANSRAMPNTWPPTAERTLTVANGPRRSSVSSSASVSSTIAPGAVHSTVAITSDEKPPKPSARLHSGPVAPMTRVTAIDSAIPTVTSPRAARLSLSAARCKTSPWSRPNTASTISAWCNAIAAASDPNSVGPSMYASTGETTPAAIVCSDKTTT